MTKVVACRDLGFDCNGVVRGETEEEVVQKVAEHAKSVHNINNVSSELVQKVQEAMREE